MTEAVQSRRGREGGRWLNERPTSEEFAEWFQANMKIDGSLDVRDYVGGVVLIPGVQSKTPYVVGFTDTGVPIIEEREELIYTPYGKVETRIAYFWDLLDAHPEWVGVIEHVDSPRMDVEPMLIKEETSENGSVTEYAKPGALATMVYQLPEGYSIMSVPVGEGYSHFLCCTVRVSIFTADDDGEPKGRPHRTGRGTKQVPLLIGRQYPYADPNSMMKAETGAMGRALGFAGIFVIPGSGVATAEDMLEAIAQGQPPAEAAPSENLGPSAPAEAPVRTAAEAQVDDDTALRARAAQLYRALSDESPDRAEQFGQWAHQRRMQSFNDASGAMLRGAVKKLEKLTQEAEQAAKPPTEGESDVPAEAPPERSAEPSASAG